MKIRDLRKKSHQELKIFLEDSQKKLGELRFKIISKQLKNIREIREIKKTVARVLTLLNEKDKKI